ncbi:MAG: hypothetical protein ACI837_001425 [Crocinitomicaceae bacterium]|jgi:hypothetical protein
MSNLEYESTHMTIIEKPLQEVTVPDGIRIETNEFYAYDPSTEYSEDLNLLYLNEDLFQAIYSTSQITVDLGWYGNVKLNKGGFKILIIRNASWDTPMLTLESKSLAEITRMLNTVLEHVASDQLDE